MSVYLHRKNNLADVENRFEARKNLGFGTLAYFDSNDVRIEGGSIITSNLVIKSENARENRFLVCKSNDGTVDFVDIELGDWINTPIGDIKFSDFNTSDISFLPRSEFQNIAFSGDYNDLVNKPTKFSDLNINLINDIGFLERDLTNINVQNARSNLGLGTLALLNQEDALTFENLTISGNLFFPNVVVEDNPKYLNIRVDGTTYWEEIIKATSTNYGVVKLSDDYNSNDTNTAASIIAVNSLFFDMKSNLERLGDVSGADEIKNTIQSTGLMNRLNNLSELSESAVFVRSNLGFGPNMERFIQSINEDNTFRIGQLIVESNVQFTTEAQQALILNSNSYLAVNKNGRVIPRNLPWGNHEQAGFVKLISDYNVVEGMSLFDKSVSTLSMVGLSNFVNDYYKTKYDNLSNQINPTIRNMYNEYMRVNQNLEVVNPEVARQNLDLHPIAHTGDFYSLNNHPTDLSSFSNDTTQFISAFNNLSDVDDIVTSRMNLKIGNIAYFNSNNVIILGGNGAFSNLTIKSNFQYQYNDTDYQDMFLKSLNPNGECRWTPLPEADSVTKGIVILESDFMKKSDNKASSAAALFKVYYKLLGEIDAINRRIDKIKTTLNV
jgi:hypothetical protein